MKAIACGLLFFVCMLISGTTVAWGSGRVWAKRVAAVLVGSALGELLEANAANAKSLTGPEIFTHACAGCHAGGGNLLAPFSKTLKATDLGKNGYDNVESIAQLVDKGKGLMAGYGSYTSPKGKLVPAKYSPEEIKAVSEYVLMKAAAEWK